MLKKTEKFNIHVEKNEKFRHVSSDMSKKSQNCCLCLCAFLAVKKPLTCRENPVKSAKSVSKYNKFSKVDNGNYIK